MWLSTDLREAADWHFKEHQKLILEGGQMLATALNEHGLDEVSCMARRISITR
jgi:glycine/serine hydroxymethyltransferase